MKLTSRLTTLLVIVLALGNATLSTVQSTRRDGNWWINQTKGFKNTYVAGFFDGMKLGYNFSYWGFYDEKNSEVCRGKIAKSFSDYNKKYLDEVTSAQIVDGLDSFYSDYKNRRIIVSDAVWLVLNGIAGTPQEEIEKMIEAWRRNAAKQP